MKKIFILSVLMFVLSQIQAQTLLDCRENRTYPGTTVKNCENRQVIVGCKADSIVDFVQNAYLSDTIVFGKVCKVAHKAIIRKRIVFVPEYATIQVCTIEKTGDVIREVYIDCPPEGK